MRLGANKLLGEPEGLWSAKVRGFEAVVPRPIELPRYEAEGAPAGVKLPAEDGGGPAGVVEGSLPRNGFDRPREFLSGVEGGEELPAGNWNRFDIVRCDAVVN